MKKKSKKAVRKVRKFIRSRWLMKQGSSTWVTDDKYTKTEANMFVSTPIRPATPEDIKQHAGGSIG